MLLSKTAKVRWNGFTRKWYEGKGYKWTKQNEFFDCKIEDMQKESTAKVHYKCDYCGSEVNKDGEPLQKEYRNLLREREIINKDCCSNRECMIKKSEEVNLIKYGVKNHMSTEKSKQRNGERCRTPFNEVIEYCINKGLVVLSKKEDYKNDRSRLLIICNNHKDKGIQETNFANIKKNKGCCGYQREELIADQIRTDGNIVYQAFVNKGFEPLFNPEDYKSNDQELPYICLKHRDKGIQYTRYGGLKNAKGCYYCYEDRKGDTLRLNEDFVFNELKKKGLIPLEGEKYINKDTPMKYKCIKHPNNIQHTSYGNFKVVKQCCDYCRAEESLAKLNRKFRSCINKWRKESEKEYNYKCALTESKEYDVHHLYTYNNIIKEALQNLNLELKNNTKDYSGEELIKLRDEIINLHNKYGLGICINKKLHQLFHSLYTKDSNTLEQFDNFKERLYSGEFNKYLQDNNIKLKEVS